MTAAFGLNCLQQDLRDVFGGRIVIDVSPDPVAGALSLAEEKATLGWTPLRKAQFAAGRALARRALLMLGRQPADILSDADGAPIWPKGVVGSISHKKLSCVVVVAHTKHLQGIGVDLELCTEKREDENEIVGRVCATPDERTAASAMKAACLSPGSVFLAAKEAFFKLQFPVTRMWLDWEGVQVHFASDMSFSVSSNAPVDAKRIVGLVRTRDHWVLAVACLAQSNTARPRPLQESV